MARAEYQPQSLVLMLTDGCNSFCRDCIVDAGPGKSRQLDTETIDRYLGQAREFGFEHVIIYGGEPFMVNADKLQHSLHVAFSHGFSVSIGTNGYWGTSENRAVTILDELNMLASEYNQNIYLALSVDEYH